VRQEVDSQLAEIFARDAGKAAAVLETILNHNFRDEDDIHLYVINVHAMKSALANVGETELSAIALRLEQAGREKDINVIKFETPEFLEKLRKTIEKIKPTDEETETGEDTEEALSFLSEKLINIKDACAVFDKKTAKTALNELREKTWSNNTKELLNKIAEHLLHSEFDNAATLADKHIKNNT
jgi:HPt (histidine-containing phosphotransfer) domain-containing protein